MVYIKRDDEGNISAISQTKLEGFDKTDITEAEFIAFIMQGTGDQGFKMLQSDLEFIRVLEDLIDVLIQKNIITITDFPESVIKKLLDRQSIRKQVSGSLGVEFYNDEDS